MRNSLPGAAEVFPSVAIIPGLTEFTRTFFVRAPASGLRQYFPQLVQAARGAGVYSTYEPADDSSVFAVQTIVRRLFAF